MCDHQELQRQFANRQNDKSWDDCDDRAGWSDAVAVMIKLVGEKYNGL